MQIEVTVIGFLKDIIACGNKQFCVQLAEGTTIADLIDELAIPEKKLRFIMFLLNGSNAGKAHVLKDGDTVKILPIIGGG